MIAGITADVAQWACVVVPGLLLLISGIAALRKFFKAKTGSKAKDYTREGLAAVASLVLGLIGFQLAADTGQRQDDLRMLEGRLMDAIEPRSIRLNKRATPSSVIDDQIAVIRRFEVDGNRDSLRIVRAVFHPPPLPGEQVIRDWVVERFSATGYPLTHLVGYPLHSSTKGNETLKHWRAQMQTYLFKFLISPVWKESSGNLGKNLTILYLPWTRSYDSWVVTSDAGPQGGLVFYSGSWDSQGSRPQTTKSLHIVNKEVSSGLEEDHVSMRRAGNRYLEEQMSLPAYSRDPCTVFCQQIAGEGWRLVPAPLAEVEARAKQRYEQWNREKSAEDRYPDTLTELSTVMRIVGR